jgi:pimeloyl-ACP methyl ester carboxylesterase
VDRLLGFQDWPEAMVRSIRAPALVVVGDADVVRPEHALELARLLPNARVAILPLTDHEGMVFAHASWLVPMVEAFLDQEVARAVSFAGP